jgi:hypothetical protein
VSVDKLTLMRRYPHGAVQSILDKAEIVIEYGPWFRPFARNAGGLHRLGMVLPNALGNPSQAFADLRFGHGRSKTDPYGFVRIEWNPAKAGAPANAHILATLTSFLPDTPAQLLANAYVNRIDFAVDLPGVRCRTLVANRRAYHKKAAIHTGADGEVASIGIGSRQTSSKTGLYLRVYDKSLPHHGGAEGVRAEIELSRVGYFPALPQVPNPFTSFRIYQFPTDCHWLFRYFASVAREKGAKRALEMVGNDKLFAPLFQAHLDQSLAPWWDPDALWQRAIQCAAGLFPAVDLTQAA